jgi:dihydroorotate dehydrogenase
MPDLYRAAWPVLRRLDPEKAHNLALAALRSGLVYAAYPAEAADPVLASTVWGRPFANPVGLAAGFDKNAIAMDAALKLGFGFVEVGAITPKPQPGNPRPRLFRLEQDRAVINRFGFNSEGMAVVAPRLARRSRTSGIVGVNLGKNKDSADAAADYAAVAQAVAPHVDYLAINVSSPNTAGLRQLQSAGTVEGIIRATREGRDRALNGDGHGSPPILLKLAPDLDWAALGEIVASACAERIDGIIVTNTTTSRPPSLISPHRNETGGLSGAPLTELSTRMLRKTYELTGGDLPLVGVGGIFSGADAYAKIRAGASLVQIYSGLVFEGPGLVNRIKRELAVLLKRDGFARLSDAVGADHGRAPGR